MRPHLWGKLWGLFAVLAWPLAPALAEGPQWQYQVTGAVKPGEQATLSLSSANGAHGVKVRLRSDQGVEKSFTHKMIKPGRTVKMKFPVPAGISVWQGELEGSAEGATTKAALELKVVAAAPLDATLTKQGVHLERGEIRAQVNHELAKVEAQIFGKDNQPLFDGELRVQMEGKQAVLRFEPFDEMIERVELKLHDPYGYWVALRIASWMVEIPHDDVVFETGAAKVQSAEAEKLDRAVQALQAEVTRYRERLGNAAADVDVRLYVAGYTDTVGSAAENLKLSRARAQAIAQYFRKQGVRYPIFYQGFGEAALAVPTEDNVDEAQNRRASYILSNTAPMGLAFPGASWQAL